jgi:cytochrome oxidase Cu insertion factor (SCO1/SenC/PrrC family)
MAAFADTGLPDAALPYVKESLATGVDAYEVAGAAVGLRGCADPPADVMAALVRAIEATAGADRTVDLGSVRPTLDPGLPTTALRELVRTIGCFPQHASAMLPHLERLAAARGQFAEPILADLRAAIVAARETSDPKAGPTTCCASTHHEPAGDEPGREGPAWRDLEEVVLQDQSGREQPFEEIFRGRTAVVAFFYTRCDNPYKCSATISRLAELHRSLDPTDAGRTLLAAITYDPAYDLPSRLHRYGIDRGVAFGDDVRFFRAVSGFAQLRSRFELGVNYGASTVNRHRIEVYVLDEGGDVTAAFLRSQWEITDVLQALRRRTS